MTAIKRYAAEDAHVIYGTAYDESLGDQLRVTVIATGLTSARARAQAPVLVVQQQPHQQPMMRTGTDNMPMLTQSISVPGSAASGHGIHAGHGLGGLNNDFAGSQVPSVWRHGRTAAAKVEALSQNGMDEIEIPAFLRKQAD